MNSNRYGIGKIVSREEDVTGVRPDFSKTPLFVPGIVMEYWCKKTWVLGERSHTGVFLCPDRSKQGSSKGYVIAWNPITLKGVSTCSYRFLFQAGDKYKKYPS